MLEKSARPPSSWAEICALKESLRAAAVDTGHLAGWTRLHEQAVVGQDTLDDWLALCRKINEVGEWRPFWGIRPDAYDNEKSTWYGCPGHRRCTRRELSVTGGAPDCHLARRKMIPLPPHAEA